MSGHSKWSTIKRAKGAADAKRGALFGKLSKKITLAAQSGIDPNFNPSLRANIDAAKKAGMPIDNIERAIRKSDKKFNPQQLTEVVFEAYGPGGSALIIEATTDNNNRTVQEVKHILTKNGGSLGSKGSVLWQFEKTGIVEYDNIKEEQKEDFFLQALDCGARDFTEEGATIYLYCTPTEIDQIQTKLQNLGFSSSASSVIMKPNQNVSLNTEDQAKLNLLIESLLDNDDIIDAFTNAV